MLTGKDTLTVTDSEKKVTELKAKNIIVATGATAAVPGAWKVDGKKVVTYLEAILQQTLPKSVVIIGSGAIGVELPRLFDGIIAVGDLLIVLSLDQTNALTAAQVDCGNDIHNSDSCHLPNVRCHGTGPS